MVVTKAAGGDARCLVSLASWYGKGLVLRCRVWYRGPARLVGHCRVNIVEAGVLSVLPVSGAAVMIRIVVGSARVLGGRGLLCLVGKYGG